MATYREIHGKAVKSLSSDPGDDYVAGQIWYNTTSDTFKTVVSSAAWVSTTNMTTARAYLAGITGTAGQTAGLVFSGNTGAPGLNETNVTEEYNGSGWSSGGNVSTARIAGVGFGTQTAAVFTGGRTPGSKQVTTTEEYNGSSWTSGGVLGTARRYLSGAGTLTSGLAFGGTSGGAPGAGTAQSGTEEYNGTAWTGGGALGTARQSGTGTGASQTSAIYFGGGNNPSDKRTETYDGSSWTEKAVMVTGASSAAGFGIESSAMRAGGATSTTSYVTNVEEWNGSSWAVNPATIASGTQGLVGQGSTTAGLISGGWSTSSPPTTNAAEEYNVSMNVITAAAWASGTAVNTGRYNGFSTASSPPSALLFFGGTYGIPGSSTNTGKTEEFNGTTWAEQTDMPGVTTTGGTGGTQTAAISMGGYQGASLIADCFSYNGSSWGTIPSLPTATGNTKGCGTSTAGLLAGGKTPAAPSGTTATWEYDGEGWASANAMSTPRWQSAVYGIQTAAVASGGQGFISTTEEYDGTNWTSGGALITASGYLGSNGALTDGLVYAGETSPAKLSTCVGYDGTAYSTRPSMATGRMGVGNGGGDTSAAAVAISGDTPQSPSAMTTAVEEFTSETSSVNVKTLTQS